MAKSATLTIRMTPETKAKLDMLAKSTNRSRSFLASQALAEYAESEAEIMDDIEISLAQVEAGLVIPHEEAMRQIRQVIANIAKSRETE